MTVTCPKCGKSCDDTYHWTYCPHEYFEMNTLVVKADGTEKRVHSLEEYREFMNDE